MTRKLLTEDTPCPKCRGQLVKRIPKRRNPKRKYHYAFYFRCLKCRRMYMPEYAIVYPGEEIDHLTREYLDIVK